jgi:hypothetical protein
MIVPATQDRSPELNPRRRCGGSIPIDRGCRVMRTIGLTALAAFGLAAPAMADGTVPQAYQGVWAAARDCRQNLQNVLATVVDRQAAACRVTQVQGSGPRDALTSTITLNCLDSPRREIWREETVQGEDTLVIVQLERRADAGGPSVDIYKRCSGIPFDEISLSDIPGNPVAEPASQVTSAPPPHHVHRQPASRRRAAHWRRQSHQ